MVAQTQGNWGDVLNTTIIGIHQVVLEDGKVLFWGGDGKGNAFSNTQKYGIFDPITGTHEILEADHVVRMFCGAGVVLPGTDKVLIAGGNGTGALGGQIFDLSEQSLTRDNTNDMATGRFYPTMVSLSSGQAVVLGGKGTAGLMGTPEIFTLGEGWRSLDGAKDTDVEANWWYPKAWVNQLGEVVYVATTAGNQSGIAGPAGSFEVMALNPSGEGSIRQIGELPFQMDAASPSAMYDVGKIIIMDTNGDLWEMDINGEVPKFSFAAKLDGDRDNSDMTVLPDGRVLINGGSREGNSQLESDAVFQSVIFDPYTGETSYVDTETVMRLYHSSTILLNDGTLLSMGGGGIGSNIDFMDAQIYTPDYLYNDDGTLADRLEITAAPSSLKPGDTFIIEVDDAASVARLSFTKTGAVTHSLNMESGRMDLDFKALDSQRIEVTLPENPNVVGAGNWMLFAIDQQGVPSIAPIISVEPTQANYDGIGDVTAEYFAIDTGTTSLDQIDFDGDVMHTERVSEINESSSTSFYGNGPADNFAIKYSGEFLASQSGSYTFYMTSDDGSRLFIDDEMMLDNDGVFAATQKTVTVDLSSGAHKIELRYFDRGGNASVDLDWSGPGFARTQMQFDGVSKNLLVNGNFESVTVADKAWTYADAKDVKGWSTLNGTKMEFWDNGHSGVTSSIGDTILELDADATGGIDAIYQDVQTEVGKTYQISFEMRARSSNAASESETVFVEWNGQLIKVDGFNSPASGTWTTYTAEVTGTGGSDRLLFREGKSDGAGPLLDNISLIELPSVKTDPDPTPDPDGVINGTDGEDYLDGTSGNDIINLLKGKDVVNGSGGSDKIIGDASSYDQVDYDGKSSDYTFTQNADETVTVNKPGGGVDILTSIDGFWFKGEEVWMPLEQALNGGVDPDPDPTTEPGGVINGTNDEDYLDGSSGDDTINLLKGKDVVNGSGGSDKIIGDASSYDQVDYDGKSSDYTFTQNADGTVTVNKPGGGVDTLTSIDGFWFKGEKVWMPLEQALNGGVDPDPDPTPEPGGVINGTNGEDYLDGSSGDDTINLLKGKDVVNGSGGSDIIIGDESSYDQVDYDGASSDYLFTQNTDGTVTVNKSDGEVDKLTSIDGFWFKGEEVWKTIEEVLKEDENNALAVTDDALV